MFSCKNDRFLMISPQKLSGQHDTIGFTKVSIRYSVYFNEGLLSIPICFSAGYYLTKLYEMATENP